MVRTLVSKTSNVGSNPTSVIIAGNNQDLDKLEELEV